MRVIGYVAYGMSRRTRFRSRGETSIISSYSRAARFDRLRRKWLLPCRVRTSLPDPVYSKRRAAALCVFNLGMVSGGRQVYHTTCQPQSHDQPRVAQPEGARIGHLGIAALAHAQGDRHLRRAKARAMRFDGALELDAEAVLLEADCSEDFGARRPIAAGQVADRHAQDTAHRLVADDADRSARPRHSAHPPARHVPRAQDDIGTILD